MWTVQDEPMGWEYLEEAAYFSASLWDWSAGMSCLRCFFVSEQV